MCIIIISMQAQKLIAIFSSLLYFIQILTNFKSKLISFSLSFYFFCIYWIFQDKINNLVMTSTTRNPYHSKRVLLTLDASGWTCHLPNRWNSHTGQRPVKKQIDVNNTISKQRNIGKALWLLLTPVEYVIVCYNFHQAKNHRFCKYKKVMTQFWSYFLLNTIM